jgi:hypothetical protein
VFRGSGRAPFKRHAYFAEKPGDDSALTLRPLMNANATRSFPGENAMAIEDEIVTLLHSPAVQSIAFVAEGVRIGGDRYKAVAKKLQDGLIIIVIDPDLAKPGSTFDGKYHPRTDTVELGRDVLGTADEKRIALHEMTHAVIDNLELPRSRGLSHFEAEGIAYIAAALYVRHTRGPAVDDTDEPFVQEADKIAAKIQAHGHHLYVVSTHEMRRLRKAIADDPDYGANPDHLQVSDGIH